MAKNVYILENGKEKVDEMRSEKNENADGKKYCVENAGASPCPDPGDRRWSVTRKICVVDTHKRHFTKTLCSQNENSVDEETKC